jgi:peptidoglycan L-alanyl-D-glutamate endopeptidase CwlK
VSNRPETLHPEVRRRWEIARDRWSLMHPNGPFVVLTQARRTNEEQAALYAQGRTKPGKVVTNAKNATTSPHGHGLAFDVAFKDEHGHIDWDDLAPFKAWGKVVESVGLAWGGRWRRPDYPHAEPLNFKGSDSRTHENPTFGPISATLPSPVPLARVEANDRPGEHEVVSRALLEKAAANGPLIGPDGEEMQPPADSQSSALAAASEQGAAATDQTTVNVDTAGAVNVAAPTPTPEPQPTVAAAVGSREVVAQEVKRVTKGSGSWVRNVLTWITGIFTSASEHTSTLLGIAPENQRFVIWGVIIGGALYLILKGIAEYQMRKDGANPALLDVT